MLFSRRKRQEELAKREAAGEVLWCPDFDRPSRVKLVHALQATFQGDASYPGDRLRAAHKLVCSELGVFYLSDADAARTDPVDDLLHAVLNCDFRHDRDGHRGGACVSEFA
jgi:hypothetical protein